MIELTEDQLQALGEPHGQPRQVINPHTREMFVLLPMAEYARLVDDESWTADERDLLRAEACELLDRFGTDA